MNSRPTQGQFWDTLWGSFTIACPENGPGRVSQSNRNTSVLLAEVTQIVQMTAGHFLAEGLPGHQQGTQRPGKRRTEPRRHMNMNNGLVKAHTTAKSVGSVAEEADGAPQLTIMWADLVSPLFAGI